MALEWMACGRPVVATKVGCLPEIVRDKVTGYLVDPKDAPALAAAIAKILHDPDESQSRWAARHRADVRQRFGMPRFVENTLEVYKAAMGELPMIDRHLNYGRHVLKRFLSSNGGFQTALDIGAGSRR